MTTLSIDSKQKIDIIEQDEMFTIRKCDWRRIKRLVNKISKPSKFISISYSVLFGIFGSASLTLIPLKNLPNLNSWIIPLYTIIAISSISLAVILLFIEKKFLKNEDETVKDINIEFDEIESLYNSTSPKPDKPA